MGEAAVRALQPARRVALRPQRSESRDLYKVGRRNGRGGVLACCAAATIVPQRAAPLVGADGRLAVAVKGGGRLITRQEGRVDFPAACAVQPRIAREECVPVLEDKRRLKQLVCVRGASPRDRRAASPSSSSVPTPADTATLPRRDISPLRITGIRYLFKTHSDITQRHTKHATRDIMLISTTLYTHLI